MIKPEVLEKTPVNVSLVKKELERIEKRDSELSFRAARTLEYLKEFARLSPKQAQALEEELKALSITRLKDEFVHKIIDVMPKSVDELKVVLQGYTLSLNNEELKKVMGVLEKHLPKK